MTSHPNKSVGSTAERLAIAAAVAPILRSVPEAVSKRRVKVYSRETGETLREATMGDALRGLAEAYAIEHTVEDRKAKGRTQKALCLQCGLEFECSKATTTPSACGKCKATACAGGCGKLPTGDAMRGTKIRRRNGSPWVCKACVFKTERWKQDHAKVHPKSESTCLGGCGKVPTKSQRKKMRSRWRCVDCARVERKQHPKPRRSNWRERMRIDAVLKRYLEWFGTVDAGVEAAA